MFFDKNIQILVLMTCFNRKALTLACLAALFKSVLPSNIKLEVFLVDDGGTDGTAEAVNNTYPAVNIIQGNGELYWNGGMQLAWDVALKKPADFYLWLNDDVELHTNAVDVLLKTYAQMHASTHEPVIVGNLSDAKTGQLTYGGYAIEKGLLHFRGVKLPIDISPSACDTLNGNIVLIPQSTVDKIGTLDKRFTHAMGDFDYGLRCKQAGIPVYSTTKFVATCSNNTLENTWSDPKLSLAKRWAKLMLHTGLPPKVYFYYIRKHTNSFTACVMVAKLFCKLFTPSLWNVLKTIKR